ncbi:MAG: CopG family transcriptional regulator, partial [Actinomycetota bacterium]
MPEKHASEARPLRTTVTFDPDVADTLTALARERGQTVSEVVNDAVRASRRAGSDRVPFVQRTSAIGVQAPTCTGRVLS